MPEPPAPSPDRQALDRLADALVADVLAAPDAEILAEFRETDGDPEQYAAQMRATFEQMVQQETPVVDPPPAPDLAAIEARCHLATPGPWEWGLDPVIEPGYHTAAHVYIGPHLRHRDATIIAEIDYDRQVDAAFIAAARTDVPALVAYARALEAENAACWKFIKQMGEQMEQAVTLAERAAVLPSPRVRDLEAENARLRAGLVEMRGLSMHAEWCWSESLRVDIDRLLRGETLPGQEL